MKINKKLFAGTYYTFFVNGLMALMLGAIMPFLMNDYNVDYDTAGIFLSAHSIGNLIASFIVVFMLSRIGRKKTIIALSSLIFLSYLGIIMTNNTFLLVPLFLLTGLGRGSISNVNNSVINDSATGKSIYLNLLHMFFAVGAFVSPLMASILISMGYSWKVVVLVGIFFSFSIIIVYLTLPLSVSCKKEGTKIQSEKEIKNVVFYKNLDFYLAAGVLFFYLGTETAVNGWVVTYLVDSGRMDSGFAQRILSLLWAVIIFGRLISAYLSVKIKNTTLILVCSFSAAVMFILFITSTSQFVTAITIILFGFFFAGIYPTTIAATGKILKGSGAAMGTLLAIASIGAIIMPMIVGFVAANLNISAGMGLVTLTAVLTVVCALILKLRERRSKIL